MYLGVALTVACNQAFGGAAHVGVAASTHPTFRPSVTRLPNHHNRRNIGTFFPAAGGFFWDGQPNAEVTQTIAGPVANDINTHTNSMFLGIGRTDIRLVFLPALLDHLLHR
jgi:hypothetical protein